MTPPVGPYATWTAPGSVYVVAEIGNNHEGDVDVARRMIEEAAATGVDAVKFQTFRTELYVSPANRERFDRLHGFELAPEDFASLAKVAREHGLDFVSTPFDLPSAEVLRPLVDAMKIASGDVDFYPLIDVAARSGRPLILSTGASDVPLVQKAVDAVRRVHGPTGPGLAVLHCVSAYPVPDGEANLAAIPTLQAAFPGLPVGYSDHTMGIDACLAAVALGARIVEKHFTLDHAYSSFRDHQLSAEPQEMKDLVSRARRVATMRGDGRKRVMPAEESMVAAIRRSVSTRRDLPAGHALAEGDLVWLRPRAGLVPGEESVVLGARLRRNMKAGEPLNASDVER